MATTVNFGKLIIPTKTSGGVLSTDLNNRELVFGDNTTDNQKLIIKDSSGNIQKFLPVDDSSSSSNRTWSASKIAQSTVSPLRVEFAIHQTSHGFSVGQALYFNGTSYQLADASDKSKVGLFIVSEVVDTDNFRAIQVGKIGGLSNLQSGKYYYVSTSTPGSLTTIEPTSGYSNPLMIATSTTEGYVLPLRAKNVSQNIFLGWLTTTPQYYSTTQIIIPKGDIEINGDIYIVGSDITITPTLTASVWHYVYVSVPSSGIYLSSSDITVSTTSPTFNSSKRAYYDGTNAKRCIGVFRTTSDPYIYKWSENGSNYYDLYTSIGILSTTSPATTSTAISSGGPSLGKILVNIGARVQIPSGGVANYVWLWNGDSTYNVQSSANAAVGLYRSDTSYSKYIVGNKAVMTNSSNQIKYYVNGTIDLQLKLNGFWLPKGMRCTN